jgi:hypothetical protein
VLKLAILCANAFIIYPLPLRRFAAFMHKPLLTLREPLYRHSIDMIHISDTLPALARCRFFAGVYRPARALFENLCSSRLSIAPHCGIFETGHVGEVAKGMDPANLVFPVGEALHHASYVVLVLHCRKLGKWVEYSTYSGS